MELRSVSKPHPLVEKTLQIVSALRGFRQLNWNTAKEILARASLKVELMTTTPKTLKPQDVLRAQQILLQKTNQMLTPENLHLHSEAAALLLIWSANVIKLYACSRKLQHTIQDDSIQLDPDFSAVHDNTQKLMAKQQSPKPFVKRDTSPPAAKPQQ